MTTTTQGPAHGPEPEDMEWTAAELTAALARAAEPESVLPTALAARVIAAGETAVAATDVRVLPFKPRASSWTARSGWLLAAAAAVAWLVVPSPFSLRNDAPQAPSAVALRDSLVRVAGVLRAAWAPSTDPAGVAASGEVVWDNVAQQGVMRFSGLAPNDPRSAQYQLWIIDAERDARYPVDGGVFDVGAEGEVLVPIHARLHVGRPTLFAVTLERPGGVVVSTRERLVLAAPVEG